MSLFQCAPPVNLLGTCDSVTVKEIGEENVVVFDNKVRLPVAFLKYNSNSRSSV